MKKASPDIWVLTTPGSSTLLQGQHSLLVPQNVVTLSDVTK